METRRSEVLAALMAALAGMELEIDQRAAQKLLDYDALLSKGNAVMNLTALTAAKDVAEKHFADSLLPLCYGWIPEGACLVDVGTGAGFPGLVLGIVRPDIELILLDATQKRVRFLEECCAALGVDAKCIHARAEDAARWPKLRDGCTVAVSRAVASAPELCELTLPFVEVGGCSICYKGGNAEQEFEGAARALQTLQAQMGAVESRTLPWGERSLVRLEKKGNTPKAYPRKAGAPHSAPL